MKTIVEQELRDHKAIQQRMVLVARRMLVSKRQLQQEIRDDMKDTVIQATIDELKKCNASCVN